MDVEIGPVASQADWKGPHLDYRKEALRYFSQDEIEEIDSALKYLKSRGETDFPDITPEIFPLPRLGAFLRSVPDELWNGRGFLLLRGLPRERYSVDDMARIYFGIGAYIGTPRVQSYQGELLGHVMDVSDIEDQARAYHAAGHLSMHTDADDIITLMCLRTAKAGGASRIASAVAVHNAIVESRPDLAEVLYRGFHVRRMEKDSQYGSGRYLSHCIPVFSFESGSFACFMLSHFVQRAADAGDVTLSRIEQEALAEFVRLAESPEFYLDMNFADGDIQLLNNRIVLHGRTDFVTDPDLTRRRHLMRLWLRVPGWPRMAPSQILNTEEDRIGWLRQRTRLAELPSKYIDGFGARPRLEQPARLAAG